MTERRPAADAFAEILDLEPDSPASRLRADRPEITQYAQDAYASLLEPAGPADLGGLDQEERELVALRVATLTPDPALAAWHRARLDRLGTSRELTAAAAAADPPRPALPARLAAILRHTDLLIEDPAAAEQPDLDALTDAGLDSRAIVTLSQLIAFLSFQVRVLALLRLFPETPETMATAKTSERTTP